MQIEFSHRAQRALDLVAVGAAAPIWLPVVGVLAGLVWLSDPSAPVFHRQKRVGYMGKEFHIWKLRTMVKNAEELKESLKHLNERIWPDFKLTNDPRVTPIGKFLRKSSFDELPQLFNVVTGDMTLVGPRPTSFELGSYQVWHTERLEVKPGLTGYWQVYSRESMFDERVRMDIRHVRQPSVRESVRLILATIPAAFKGK